MKTLATGLLLLAATVFVIANLLQEQPGDVWSFIRAASEGAMVGALADWFAVTALFRHPMGLPIPHTAIVIKRKNEIGYRLADFIQSHFLRYRVLLKRMEQARPAKQLMQWLATEEGSAWTIRLGSQAGRWFIATLDDEQVSRFLRKTVLRQLEHLPVPDLLAEVLSVVTREHRHRLLLNRVLEIAMEAFEDFKPHLREHIETEIPWYAGFLRQTAYRRVVRHVHEVLRDVAADPLHPLRRQIEEQLELAIFRLRADPDWQERVTEIWQQVLRDESLRDFTDGAWAEMKGRVGEALADDRSSLRADLRKRLRILARGFLRDEALMHKAERVVLLLGVRLLRYYREPIAQVIADEVGRWEARETSDLIENQIGSDLQWIRINGTVVGGMAGLLIYTVGHFVL
jgi:uncharacterized membrane-anchored protein YjiN (DUF445 family)